MNKRLIKLVEQLNHYTGKDYKLDLYTDGYGLSLEHKIIASGVKGITEFCRTQLNK